MTAYATKRSKIKIAANHALNIDEEPKRLFLNSEKITGALKVSA